VPPRLSEAGPGLRSCGHDHPGAEPRFIVLTGGPGAGKTAVLDIARQRFCQHVLIVDEAASILFGGGFPRADRPASRRAAQRAIYHVQLELEAVARAEGACIVLCDRGTLDGLAYWPGDWASFFAELATTRERDFRRYEAVIHLRTPAHEHYSQVNPLRLESAERAAEIDRHILRVWDGHPRRYAIDGEVDFLVKASKALALVEAELPACCRHVPEPSAARA
jgi:predicted ATPase